MSRKAVIKAYENLMFSVDEVDIWEDEIIPALEAMTTAEIIAQYEADKAWYSWRSSAARV